MNVYASDRQSAKKRNKEFEKQMFVMNGLSFKSENKCSFVHFRRFDVYSLDGFVVRMCVSVPKYQNAVFLPAPTKQWQIF